MIHTITITKRRPVTQRSMSIVIVIVIVIVIPRHSSLSPQSHPCPSLPFPFKYVLACKVVLTLTRTAHPAGSSPRASRDVRATPARTHPFLWFSPFGRIYRYIDIEIRHGHVGPSRTLQLQAGSGRGHALPDASLSRSRHRALTRTYSTVFPATLQRCIRLSLPFFDAGAPSRSYYALQVSAYVRAHTFCHNAPRSTVLRDAGAWPAS